MAEIRISYSGELRCSALHTPSGNVVETEPAADNHGGGGSFSPSDLLAAALGASMVTSIALVAAPKGIDLTGLRVVVRNQISEDLPRRVEKMDVEVYLPITEDHPEKKVLQSAALSCTVRHSLHPETRVAVTWFWRQLSLPGTGTSPPVEDSAGETDTSWLDKFKRKAE